MTVTSPPGARFTLLGRAGVGAVHEVERGLVVITYDEGARETAADAAEGVAFLRRYLDELPHPGVVIVVYAGLAAQGRGARQAHASWKASEIAGISVVGGRPLARAIRAFFLRFYKFGFPLAVHRTLDEAMPWAQEQLARAKGAA